MGKCRIVRDSSVAVAEGLGEEAQLDGLKLDGK
jgi:hypothetical protein